LKFFEAALLGVPSCASPTSVYRQVIKDGVSGYLVEDGDWYGRISRILADRSEAQKIGIAAREFVSKEYFGEHVANLVENTLLGFIN
jgi:glycosyltransferase involved in cell wall biosynthesis